MKQYFISKKNYNGEVVFVKLENIKGYKFNPKDNCQYEGIKVNEMVIIKPELISKIIKRKIKYKIDQFLQLIIDNLDGDNDSDTQKSLNDLKKYRKFINERYSIYLDETYMNLLNKKINIIERELKNNLVYSKMIKNNYEEPVSKKTR